MPRRPQRIGTKGKMLFISVNIPARYKAVYDVANQMADDDQGSVSSLCRRLLVKEATERGLWPVKEASDGTGA